MNESSAVPEEALADVAYLSRSANRVRVLDALAVEAYPRRELEDATSTTKTTLGRILSELEERDWARRRSDGHYVATARGSLVVSEFTALVEAMDVVQRLGEAATWLPVDELSIGLEQFGDATVRRSAPHAPLELVEYMAELVRDATTFRVLTFLAPPPAIGEAMQANVAEGGCTMEGVITDGLLGHLRDRERHPPDWREFVAANGRLYRYDGYVPCNLFVMDETVLVMSGRPEGRSAAVQIEDERVRAAFEELFERYRAESERVDAAFFA
jgi:predicted transcriptional regulator